MSHLLISSVRDHAAADRTDEEYLAGTFPEKGIHTRFKGSDFVKRHERLDRTRKTAAMYAECADPVEQMLSDRKCHTDRLICRISVSADILKIVERGFSGLGHELQELIEVSLFKGCDLLIDAGAVIVIMNGAKDRTVSDSRPDLRNSRIEITLRDLREDFLSERSCDGSHLRGNRGIIICEICMIGPCIRNAERIAGFAEITLYRMGYRILLILEVDRNDSAESAAHLIQKT